MSTVSSTAQHAERPAPTQLKTVTKGVVSSDVFRDVVEILLLSSTAPIVVLEVVGGDLAKFQRVRADLENQLPDDAVVGCIDEQRFGIVLPYTTSFEAQLLIESGRSQGKLTDCELTIWTSESKWDACAQSVLAMYAQPIPAWKRLMDVVGALLILAFVTPVLLAASVAIKLTSPGPVVFRQQRVGRGGVTFDMYKLRTMRSDAEELRHELLDQNELTGLAFKIKEDPRVTPVGKWLRRLSIDELPQLLNILKGEMSLVGPRPLPVADWQPTVSWYCRRHDVLPGLTGLWQVSGRCEIDFDTWVKMDLEYIDKQSLWMDCALLVRTIPAVLMCSGAA